MPEHPDAIVRRPKTLSIMPTYTCPAACAHCGSLSGPDERTVLPLTKILAAIEEAKELGFHNVVFTGGEATLRWHDLLIAIRRATDLGFPTRIVSNAHWATSPKVAGRRLDELMAAGLAEINFSTGDEHARFIPVDRVITAIVASLERGLPVWVVVELRGTRQVRQATIEEDPRIAALPAPQRKLLTLFEGPWMPLDPAMVETYPDGITTDRGNLAGRMGCDNVLQTYTLQADGKVAACCGIGQRLIPELTVGPAEGPRFLAQAIERAEGDFLKLWIRYIGPEKILAWAATKDPSIAWEGRYGHHCQACAHLYKDPRVTKVIREHYEEMIGTVIAAAWLDERELPRRLTRTRTGYAPGRPEESGSAQKPGR